MCIRDSTSLPQENFTAKENNGIYKKIETDKFKKKGLKQNQNITHSINTFLFIFAIVILMSERVSNVFESRLQFVNFMY